APGVARGRPGDAPEGGHAKVLAEVHSATVGQQVDLMLQTSDNYLAEVMGRMTALGVGRPGSSDDAIAAVLQQVKDMGVPTDSLRAADVSGLAPANRVSPRQLTDVVRAMTSGTDPRLRAALSGFPVAGLTGTLGDRYTDAASAAGAGLVRAKTGTLNTVIALSGSVVDADGRLLVFSFVGNGLTPGAANKAALDRSAAVLAGCGWPEGGHAKVLAEVHSATVGQQVDLMLQTSDNYLAEVMGRMTALGVGRPGSSDDAIAAVLQQVKDMGVPTDSLRAADVSGLAPANRVSPRQLTDVVRAMTSGTDPRLRAALSGFPVAGLTGTLGDRYTDAASAAGAGLVRAKTGTLNTVIALSGSVVDADGRLLVFSFVGNGLTPGAANKAA
ncbi:D-alanyl-D-alanine carboxypeptidase/D-alanyl-D-alanine-endopeptidase, partial [Arthrobacter sp. I3]|uniref:D-alanyl-D-alanine carboxypeptidase/D-alanyl-D-alanine endopeptidase n=1 Tax=Arthrobacter sp. I3 TaxID=218158 RepID=UPI0020A67C20